MRQTISKLVAAFAVIAVSAAPAMACGGLFGSVCSPCAGTTYMSPCAMVYAPPVYTGGCNTCGGWGYERLAEPTTQYYYANQGPFYSGPGMFAPYPTYQESAIPNPDMYRYYPRYNSYPRYYGYHHYYHYGYRWHHHYYHRPWRTAYRYGRVRHYGMPYGYHHRWGYPVLRREY